MAFGLWSSEESRSANWARLRRAQSARQVYFNPDDTTSQFTGWLPEGVGRVTVGGRTFTIDQGDFRVSTGRWALVDHSVPSDSTLYPEWPYQPIIEEGYGDTLYVQIYWDDWSGEAIWVGVVEKGNLTIHKDRK
jgi:hypothetical protein